MVSRLRPRTRARSEIRISDGGAGPRFFDQPQLNAGDELPRRRSALHGEARQAADDGVHARTRLGDRRQLETESSKHRHTAAPLLLRFSSETIDLACNFETSNRLALELANALSRDSEDLADLLECLRPFAGKPEAQLEHLTLSFR